MALVWTKPYKIKMVIILIYSNRNESFRKSFNERGIWSTHHIYNGIGDQQRTIFWALKPIFNQ